MRGLIFTGGAAPDMKQALPLFGSYGLAIAADSGLYAAENAGVVPDLIIGDMDSLGDSSVLERYPENRVIRWPRDKDYTDTELALAIMKERRVDDVVLIGGCGGRLDHLFAIKALYDTDFFPSVWIGDESVVIAVGERALSREVRISAVGKDDPVSVFPVGAHPHKCSATGLHWAIDELKWNEGGYSLSNRCSDGNLSVRAESGRFIVIVPLSRCVAIERFS